MKRSRLASFLEMPVITDPRGNLCVVESKRQVPFPIERVYYLYDVPAGARRAGHAHAEQHEILFALSGSFDVRLDNGQERETHTLNRPHVGLHIGPMTWRDIDNFSSGSVCMVIASAYYDEADYIRSYDDFLVRTRR
jgi:hypothetical protein